MTMDIIKTEQKRFPSLLEIVRRKGDLLLKRTHACLNQISTPLG